VSPGRLVLRIDNGRPHAEHQPRRGDRETTISPEGATIRQPRATPWVTGRPTTTKPQRGDPKTGTRPQSIRATNRRAQSARIDRRATSLGPPRWGWDGCGVKPIPRALPWAILEPLLWSYTERESAPTNPPRNSHQPQRTHQATSISPEGATEKRTSAPKGRP